MVNGCRLRLGGDGWSLPAEHGILQGLVRRCRWSRSAEHGTADCSASAGTVFGDSGGVTVAGVSEDTVFGYGSWRAERERANRPLIAS